jgi:hypothetical protein
VPKQDVEIIVTPVPRILKTWLIGIGKIISTLIRLKARPLPILAPRLIRHCLTVLSWFSSTMCPVAHPVLRSQGGAW